MAFFKIPLNPFPETFSITINNVEYTGMTRWNAVQGCWMVSLANTNNVPILQNIPVIPGVNLLDQFDYLNLGVKMAALLDYDPATVPPFESLGTTGNVYVETP